MSDPAIVALGNASLAQGEVAAQMKRLMTRIRDLEAALEEILEECSPTAKNNVVEACAAVGIARRALESQ